MGKQILEKFYTFFISAKVKLFSLFIHHHHAHFSYIHFLISNLQNQFEDSDVQCLMQ